MCPLYPFHVIILYLCLLLPLLFAVIEGADELAGIKWNLSFMPKRIDGTNDANTLKEYGSIKVELNGNCTNCSNLNSISDPGNLKLVLTNEKQDIASLSYQDNDEMQTIELKLEALTENENDLSVWKCMFNISGKFLGYTEVKAQLKYKNEILEESMAKQTKKLDVAVLRKKTIQSKLFAYSVAILVSLAYINMGCALDLDVVKNTLKRPIGPAIGFICQFLVMPLLAYALGFIFGTKSVAMRLGLFVTGASPGGGASNIWTVMFGGNLDLSVTMTAVSTFSAFFMMPFWIFTLGATIFDERDIVIPYKKICIYAFFLVVPLTIGLILSRFAPKVSAFMVKILKPLALFLILFIVIFGVWANLYIFKMMTWQVFLGGMGLPWIGFLLGFSIAKLSKRPMEDVIAIAIETGVQNTGMSIFLLWLTLDQPLGDMTAVIPVAAATMTPLPLLAALIFLKVKGYFTKNESTTSSIDGHTDETESPIIKTKIVLDDMVESESTQKLVNGDANDNLVA